MAEFQFYCPQCNQHIQCDTGYAGKQINCPICQQAIVVPQPPRASGATSVAVKSKTMRKVLVITASAVALAALMAGGWFGYSTIKLHLMPPGLINVDFGGGGGRGSSLKTGFAAVGRSADDFWNFYDRDASSAPRDWRKSGTLMNLKLANGKMTTVGMSVSDAPGAYSKGSTDEMYKVFDYPLDGGNDIVTFKNLPAGKYDVLAYSPDGNFEVTVGGTSYGVKKTYDSPVSDVPIWKEGTQYARFRSVVVKSGQPLILTVRNGASNPALLCGVQILSEAF
jgi:hypothetical protein